MAVRLRPDKGDIDMAKGRARRVVRWLGLLIAGVLIVAGVFVVNAIWFKPFFINVFFERVFNESLLQDPEMLTDLRLLEPFGSTSHNAKLTDASPAFDEKMWQKSKRDLDTLRRYDRGALSSGQQLSYDILEWYLDDSVRAKPFLYYNYPVNQMFGVQNDLPTFMAMKHQVHSVHDADHYITRLTKFGEKFDQVIEAEVAREHRSSRQSSCWQKYSRRCAVQGEAAPEHSLYVVAGSSRRRKRSPPRKGGTTRARGNGHRNRCIPLTTNSRAVDRCKRARPTTTARGAPDGDKYYAYACAARLRT